MYAVAADLERAYGRETIERLSTSDEDPDGSERTAEALAHARSVVDAHLSTRFRLPLPHVPDLLRAIAADLAVARLAVAADQLIELYQGREKRALADLERIAAGKMNLGLPELDAPAAGGPRPVFGPGGSKLFTRDSLRSL